MTSQQNQYRQSKNFLWKEIFLWNYLVLNYSITDLGHLHVWDMLLCTDLQDYLQIIVQMV